MLQAQSKTDSDRRNSVNSNLTEDDRADLRQVNLKVNGSFKVSDPRLAVIRQHLQTALGTPQSQQLLFDADGTDSAIRGEILSGKFPVNGSERKEIKFKLNLQTGGISLDGEELQGESLNAALQRLKNIPPKSVSAASAPHAVAGALIATEEFLGKDLKWSFPKGAGGPEFAAEYDRLKREIPGIQELIKFKAQQGGVDEVNKWLKKYGFDIELKPFSPNDTGPRGERPVAAAAIVDVKVEWETPGEKSVIKVGKTPEDAVPAVKMANLPPVHTNPNHPNPIVEIPTTDGMRFFITKYDGRINPDNPVELNNVVRALSTGKVLDAGARERFPGGLLFPMADYERSGVIPALIGASAFNTKDGAPAIITQAQIQERFRMNELGARGEAAAAVAVGRGFSLQKAQLEINGNYIAWFEKPQASGAPVIPFAAFVTKEHMKEPKGLN